MSFQQQPQQPYQNPDYQTPGYQQAPYQPMPPSVTPQPVVVQQPVVMVQPQAATPLIVGPGVVGRTPMRMRCPHCGADVVSEVRYEAGVLTWIAVLFLFFFFCIFSWVPLVVDACKDAVHICPACRANLGRKAAI